MASGVGAVGSPTQRLADSRPAALIQSGLGGASITNVSAEMFAEAVKRAVIASPKQAAAILTAALSVTRGDMDLITGRLVGAAIEGLGPKARESDVLALVRIGVEVRPSAVLFIVRAAVRASPDSFMRAIENAANTALKNPSSQVIARIDEVGTNAKSGGDNDYAGLELVPGLEVVGELDSPPPLNATPFEEPPVAPVSTPTPRSTPSRSVSPSL